MEQGKVYLISKASLRNKRGNFNQARGPPPPAAAACRRLPRAVPRGPMRVVCRRRAHPAAPPCPAPSSPRPPQTRHQYEIHLENGSQVELCPDEEDIPFLYFNVRPGAGGAGRAGSLRCAAPPCCPAWPVARLAGPGLACGLCRACGMHGRHASFPFFTGALRVRSPTCLQFIKLGTVEDTPPNNTVDVVGACSARALRACAASWPPAWTALRRRCHVFLCVCAEAPRRPAHPPPRCRRHLPPPPAAVVDSCQDWVTITKRDGTETQARVRAASARRGGLQRSAARSVLGPSTAPCPLSPPPLLLPLTHTRPRLPRPTQKRSMVVRDDSGRSIELTLWGTSATGSPGDQIQAVRCRRRGQRPRGVSQPSVSSAAAHASPSQLGLLR